MSEQFGHYVLETMIGRGGMGEVYRAYDTKRDRVVALKRLPKELASDEIFQARFRRECRLVARLNEPHVIPIHDFGEINGHLFLDMRLVDGVDLSTVINDEGPMESRLAVDIIGQVAAALQSAHTLGLIHRDIKPSNVLVTGMTADRQSVFAYLVDFGIARSEGAGGGTALTATTGTVGTLGYMAPERISGGDGDSRSDLYSLACVLYECLTGHSPFKGETFQVMYAHVNSPPPLPSAEVAGLPRALDDVIRKGLAKDPADRFQTASQFAAAARAALAEAGVTPPPPPPGPPSGPQLPPPSSGPIGRHTAPPPQGSPRSGPPPMAPPVGPAIQRGATSGPFQGPPMTRPPGASGSPSGPHPSGPHASGPYPSGSYQSGPYQPAPYQPAPYQSGPPPSGPHASGPFAGPPPGAPAGRPSGPSAQASGPHGFVSGPQSRPPSGPVLPPPQGPQGPHGHRGPQGPSSSGGGIFANRKNLIPISIAVIVVILAAIIIVVVSSGDGGDSSAQVSGAPSPSTSLSASGGSKDSVSPSPSTSASASDTSTVTPGWDKYSQFSNLVGNYAKDTTNAYKGGTCTLEPPVSTVSGMLDQIECTGLSGTKLEVDIGRFDTADNVAAYVATLVNDRKYTKQYWTIATLRRGQLYEAPTSAGVGDVVTSFCSIPLFLVKLYAPDGAGLSSTEIYGDYWKNAPFPNDTPDVCSS